MKTLKNYIIVGAAVLALCYASFLIGQWKRHNKDVPLPVPAAVALAPSHTFTTKRPMRALDKPVLKKEGFISKEVEMDATREVTAAAVIVDDSGRHRVTNQVNIDSGQSVLIQQRPAAEFLSRNAIGIGAGFRQAGFFKEVYYRRDLGRVWDCYLLVGGDLYFLDNGKHDYQAWVKTEYRW